MLREYGADVTVCCQDVYHYSNEELAEKYLADQEYDLIGIGFLIPNEKHSDSENLQKSTGSESRFGQFCVSAPGAIPVHIESRQKYVPVPEFNGDGYSIPNTHFWDNSSL